MNLNESEGTERTDEPSKVSKEKTVDKSDSILNFGGDEALSLEEAQVTVDRWIKTIGVRYFSELTNLAQLVEEVGELARIISRTYGEQSFKPNEKPCDLSDEMADVLFVLICLANQTGVDLTSALKANLDKKAKRDSQRHQNNAKLRSEHPDSQDSLSE